MEKYNQIQYVIGKDDLKEIICEIIDERIALIDEKYETTKNDEELLTSEKVMELLDISKTTLWRWKQRGYLTPIRIGGIDRYRLGDIRKKMNG